MKREQPTITYTEILARAARSIEQEIAEWNDKAEGLPGAEELLSKSIGDLRSKLEAVETMYRIETGTDL